MDQGFTRRPRRLAQGREGLPGPAQGVEDGQDHHPRVWGLASDWHTVQRPVRSAVPLGLRYVTIAPQNMLTSLFASAQATITVGGEAS
ncbi:hypothetical protein [Streptomyces sp. NPDC086010]|uniref:hypothetical protein n=1 Tax=Streptomyces sp. NPDC086010 TaxID=3365745 RepID=UPI0037D627A8